MRFLVGVYELDAFEPRSDPYFWWPGEVRSWIESDETGAIFPGDVMHLLGWPTWVVPSEGGQHVGPCNGDFHSGHSVRCAAAIDYELIANGRQVHYVACVEHRPVLVKLAQYLRLPRDERSDYVDSHGIDEPTDITFEAIAEALREREWNR